MLTDSYWCYASTFQREYFRSNIKLVTVTGDKIGDEKLQYSINWEAAKISALWSGKIDKYEYLTGKEILLSNQ